MFCSTDEAPFAPEPLVWNNPLGLFVGGGADEPLFGAAVAAKGFTSFPPGTIAFVDPNAAVILWVYYDGEIL